MLSIAIAVVFGAGLALFGLGTLARRKQSSQETPGGRITWPRSVDDSLGDVDVDQRIEMIARLAILRTQWARNVLQQARHEEADARAKAAIDDALSAAPSSISPEPTPDT